MDRPVKDIRIESDSVADLIKSFVTSGGFTAPKFARAVEIMKSWHTSGAHTFLSFPAALMATGTRGVLVQLIEAGWIDTVVTTCGTLDHDIARSFRDYYHGSFRENDADLHRNQVNRLGNVLVPNSSYGLILEDKLQPWLVEAYQIQKHWAGHELIKFVGGRLEALGHHDSLIATCSRLNVPVIVPGWSDGAWGNQLWSFWQDHRDFHLDIMQDQQLLAGVAFEAEETAALMIGGGISKHHTIWWNQYRDGLDHAVYITTAVEHDGSLSGARLPEAISWGKVKEVAPFVTVEGEASLLLPLLVAALLH